MFVDDALHAQILRLLLRKGKKPTIVIATGDGNGNDNYTSFIQCVTDGVTLSPENGGPVKVEIVSWKNRLNERFLELAAKYPRLITIKYLESDKHNVLNLSN